MGFRDFDEGDGTRGNRRGARRGREMDADRMPRDRKPLVWEDKQSFESGNAVAMVSAARSDTGAMLYSYAVGRRGRDGGVLRFLKPGDQDDAVKVMKSAEAWIAAQQHSVAEA